MLKFDVANGSPFVDAVEKLKAYLKEHQGFYQNQDFLLKVADTAQLCLENNDDFNKPFTIDLFNQKLLWRLNHSGKGSEAVCKAVLSNLDKPIVFDATAGLGRESLILQSVGCKVYMFERNPIIWFLLHTALYSAQNNQSILDSLKNGLPTLTNLGSFKDQVARGELLPSPDVIYYDPMFPQRQKSALVKKDMRVFHELVGFDEDTTEYANFLLTKAKHHLVVKRPSNEEPLKLDLRCSSQVSGKACRFDCYYCGN